MKRCFAVFASSQRPTCRHLHQTTIKSQTGVTALRTASTCKQPAIQELPRFGRNLPKSKREWSLIARARRKSASLSGFTDDAVARSERASMLEEALSRLSHSTCSSCKKQSAPQLLSGTRNSPSRDDNAHRDPFVMEMKRLARNGARNSMETVLNINRHLDSRSASRAALTYAYEIALGYATRLRKFAWLRQLAQNMISRDLAVTTRAMNATLGLFAAEGSLDQWHLVFVAFSNLGVLADTSTWNQLLTLCTTTEQTSVFAKMEELDIVPDHVTLAIMMPLWRARYSSAAAFLQAFESVDWTPSLGDILVAMLVHEGERVVAVNLILSSQRMQLSPTGAERLLDAQLRFVRASPLGRSLKYRTSVGLQNEFLRRGIQFSPKMYHLLMEIAIKLRKSSWHALLQESYELQCMLDANFARRHYRIATLGYRVKSKS